MRAKNAFILLLIVVALLAVALCAAPAAACRCYCPPPPPPPPGPVAGGAPGISGYGWKTGEWGYAGWQDHGYVSTVELTEEQASLIYLHVQFPNGGRLKNVQAAYLSDPNEPAVNTDGSIGYWFPEPRGFNRWNVRVGPLYAIHNPMHVLYVSVEKVRDSPTPITLSLETPNGRILWTVTTTDRVSDYTIHLVR